MPQVVGPGPLACLEEMGRTAATLCALTSSNCIRYDFCRVQAAAEALMKVDGIGEVLLKGSPPTEAMLRDRLTELRDASFLAARHVLKAHRDPNPNCYPAFELFQQSWGRLQRPLRDLLPSPRIAESTHIGFGRSF